MNTITFDEVIDDLNDKRCRHRNTHMTATTLTCDTCGELLVDLVAERTTAEELDQAWLEQHGRSA